jgi:hypothetical protein
VKKEVSIQWDELFILTESGVNGGNVITTARSIYLVSQVALKRRDE